MHPPCRAGASAKADALHAPRRPLSSLARRSRPAKAAVLGPPWLAVADRRRRLPSAPCSKLHALTPGILLIIMREGDRPVPPPSKVVPTVVLCLAALLLLGILLTNRGLRAKWSNRSRFTSGEWLQLIVMLLLGVALGHIIYLWLYPGFTLNSRLIVDVVTFFLGTLLLICLAMRLPKQN